MAELINVGPVPGEVGAPVNGVNPPEWYRVGEREAVTAAMAGDSTQAQVDAYINGKLTPYVNRSYVTSQDNLNATKAYIDGQDNLRVKTAQKDVANGVAALQADGRISPNRINAPNNQRRPRTPWTPSSYGTDTAISGPDETTLFTIPVTNPGYTHRLLVQGQIDGLTNTAATAPQINVRVGSATGTLIASGVGMFDSYNTLGGDTFNRTTTGSVGGYWSEHNFQGSTGNPFCDGSSVSWNAEPAPFLGTPSPRVMMFLRSGDDATTYDDYQEITMVMASKPEWGGVGFGTSSGENHIYGRVNADRTQWVRFGIRPDTTDIGGATVTCLVTLTYNNGSYNPQQLAQVSRTVSNNDVWTAQFGTASGKRWYRLLLNGTDEVINYNDSGAQASMGLNHRAWGFGVRAGVLAVLLSSVRQSLPGRVDNITINDLPPGTDGNAYAPVTVMPVSVGTLPALSAAARTLHVTATRYAATGTITARPSFRPNLTVTAIPA
jgi:hypothetical protein